jgi:hypothetical protein
MVCGNLLYLRFRMNILILESLSEQMQCNIVKICISHLRFASRKAMQNKRKKFKGNSLIIGINVGILLSGLRSTLLSRSLKSTLTLGFLLD